MERPHLSQRLRRFTTVSAAVTVLDVAILATGRSAGWGIAAADAVAVLVASLASWLLHRRITLGDDPLVRWVHQPLAFAGVAALAGAVDVFYTSLLPGSLALTKVAGLAVAALVRVVAYRAVLLSPIRRDLRSRDAQRPAPPGDRRFTVVIPAYREANRIAATVEQVREALEGIDLEVLVVDDGSPDATADAAEAAGARVVRLTPNRGKGAAVRAGMLAASGRAVAFTDADLAYSPHHLRTLLAEVEAGWDVAVGNRWHPDSVAVRRPSLLRQASSRFFNLVTATVLLGRYRDTQSGCKAFRSDAARMIFERTRVDGFAFDVEVLHLVERYRLSLTEVPVQVTDGGTSTVRVGVAAVGMVRDLLRVRWWGHQGLYDRDPAGAGAVDRAV